ncbi:MAG: DUF3592 domain-containing protein [Bacteroidota bacterium]
MAVSDEQKEHVRGLLIQGRKIEAIKYVSDNFGLGLKESKELVELIDEDISDDEYRVRPNKGIAQRSGKNVGKLVGGIFAFVGLIFLTIVVFVFMSNQELANNGVVVTATVVDDPYQPTFEYIFEGDTLYYYSSTSSDPPSYRLGEQVEMFVNPVDPYDTLVNTFMDRWFLIVLLGGMGTVFFGVGVLAFTAFKN